MVRKLSAVYLDYYYIGIHKKKRIRKKHLCERFEKMYKITDDSLLLLLKQRFKEYYNDDGVIYLRVQGLHINNYLPFKEIIFKKENKISILEWISS